MSVFAGAFQRARDQGIPDAVRSEIRANVSRTASDVPIEHSSRTFYMAFVGIHDDDAQRLVREPSGNVLAVSGTPRLRRGAADVAAQIAYDVPQLMRAVRDSGAGLGALLSQTNGDFSAVWFDEAQQALTVMMGRLGVRPIYVAYCGDLVIFSTALRVLEAMASVPRIMDVHAVTEAIHLGSVLGTRTPYVGIEVPRSAELVRIARGSITRSVYVHWQDLAPIRVSLEEHAAAAFACFRDAVRDRQGTSRHATAFLTGGMDSRAIAASLADDGVSLRTVNLAFAQTQDAEFARAFARVVGATHIERPDLAEAWLDYSVILADVLDAVEGVAPGARPARRAWSGDGGSVGAGYVYMEPALVEALRTKGIDAGISAFLTQMGAHEMRRVLTHSAYATLDGALAAGIRAELSTLREDLEPVRRFHLFLMLNDQRRHMARHFENMDLHRIELEVPFWDHEFLSMLLAMPAEWGLRHHFYGRWFEHFPASTRSVPWQTYPGHEPCPLPIPTDLRYQWSVDVVGEARRRRRRQNDSRHILMRTSGYPSPILQRVFPTLAWMLDRAGIRNFAGALDAVLAYTRYWDRANGRVIIDAREAARHDANGNVIV